MDIHGGRPLRTGCTPAVIETDLQIRSLPLTILMSKNRDKDSASSRKRKLSDGNEAAGQAISRGTTPADFKRSKRGGHGASDQQSGSNNVSNASPRATENHT